MSALRKTTAYLIAICMVFCFCGCSGNSDARIYVALYSMPKTLDPQTAESDSELLIARNIYEGLMRQNSKGEIVPGAIENYDYSALTYTFILKGNLFWSDGKPLTAKDFVFGIKRALTPKTQAPFAKLLYAIEGAAAAHSGQASVDNIGVTAPDNKTLIIKLAYEDKDFLTALSMPVSMPCNQEFFIESVGKYGLEKDCVLCNGTYKLARWNKQGDGIRLYKNENYKGDFTAKNGGVFIAKDKEKTVSEKLLSGDADIAFLKSENLAEIAESKKIKTVSVQNICWVLSLGGELTDNIRQALCMCVLPDVYNEKLPQGFCAANSFFPDVLNINEPDNTWAITYDSVTPQSLISQEIKNTGNKKFPQTTLIYSQSDPVRPAITQIAGNWQGTLSAFINIKATDKSLQSELKDHSLSLCVFPVKADYNIGEYLTKFGIDYNGDVAAAYGQMLGNYNLLPIAFQDTIAGYNDNISGVYMNSFGGYIDFSYILKK